jgi:hypothetical protein
MQRAAAAIVFLVAAAAHADPPCGVVEVRFQPGAQQLQIVAWIENANADFVDTLYITRAVGNFGLGNRPGDHLLVSNWHTVYGRRDMVFPVWSHHRDHHYPLVVMGGACGNSPATCNSCSCGSPPCEHECWENTVAYHEVVSSTETSYCEPQTTPLDTSHAVALDVMTCASGQRGSFSKGAYADAPAFSLYPPRADVVVKGVLDSPDVLDFANQNDLVAVSQATPLPGGLVSPPIFWAPINQPAGDYVAWIEVSQQYDWSAGHSESNPDHLPTTDPNPPWGDYGHPFAGQPAVLYKVPFHYDGTGSTEIATDYAGYSTWDGSDGTLHAPDGTITNGIDGSGSRRIVDSNDGSDVYRVKVVVGSCAGGVIPIVDLGGPHDMGGDSDAGTIINPGCPAPDPAGNLKLVPSPQKVDFTFTQPSTGATPAYYEVRYRVGLTPIASTVFEQQSPAPSVNPGKPGDTLSGTVDQLMAQTSYGIAVRAVAACGSKSAVVSQVTATPTLTFAVLHSCFVATAAFGSPMMAEVAALRKFRDAHLLRSPAGRLLTAAYYAFSPPLAALISTDENLRALARRALAPIVTMVTR